MSLESENKNKTNRTGSVNQMDRTYRQKKAGSTSSAGANTERLRISSKQSDAKQSANTRSSARTHEDNLKNKKAGAAKKSRKLTTKGKKAVRRAIAGVLLASAVIVAAIPSDRSGMASAGNDVTNRNDAMDYSADSALDRNGDFSAGSDIDSVLSNAAGATEYTSYEIRNINNRPTLVWKYNYFIPSGGLNESTVGIISGYNDSYSVDTLNLSGLIYTGYDITSMSDYETWWGTHASDSFAITDITATMNTDLDRIARYFGDNTTFTSWRTRYENAVAQYKTDHDGAEPASFSDIGMSSDTLSLIASDMSSDLQRIYYCDNNNLAGYTLTEVQNYAQGSTYLVDPNAGTTDTVPNDSRIYIAKLNNAADITTAGTNYDENGYKYLSFQAIGAIGNDAFKDTKLVNTLVLGDGITYVGDSAFENSFIKNVDFQSVTYIGNRVFKGCLELKTLNLISQTAVIGKEAFYGCKQLTSVSIPSNTTDIGFGAFAECTLLSDVSFDNSLGCNIGEYAFYNDPNISEVSFPDSFGFSFGKAAFALEPGTGTNAKLETFEFPENMTDYESYADSSFTGYTLYDDNGDSYTSKVGDYLFANRYNLEKVVMPSNFGSSSVAHIPMDTFDQCRDLGLLQFDSNENSYVLYDSNLFEDVENEDLYVFGPQYKATSDASHGGNVANPRYSTWQANSKSLDYVPYVYNDGTKDHYEVGIDDYRYELEINADGESANLISCDFTGDPAPIEELIIPSSVAAYSVAEMADGCLDPIKDYVKKLTVLDDSLTSIDDNVFNGADLLEEVDLGNSVTSIGDSAFANCPELTKVTIGENIETVGAEAFKNCPELENVTWEEPSSTETLTSIGSDAFYTGSDKLYFHGDMEDDYAPFEYAMGSNSINSDSTRIAYQSLDPAVYTAIMDDATDKVLLIDYPLYEDLDSTIRDKYESGQALNDEEQAKLDATLYLNVPEAVESIDIKPFLEDSANNVNRKDWIYVDDSTPLSSSLTKMEIFGDDDATLSGTAISSLYDDGYSAGLFSGYYNDDTALDAYGDPDYLTYDGKGNDWILSVSIPGVTEIPDYAFDSCERLQSVIIGDECETIGESAFQDCMDLTTIGTNDNPYYEFENGILYENLDDGTYEINTCLPARGIDRSSSTIWVNEDNDPKISDVSSIKEGAFASCEYITKVDLSDSDITSVPKNCFDGCETLSEVILPDTVRNISSEAFDNGAPALDVTLPCDSQISDTAFDPDATVTIWTYPDCTITAGYEASNNDEVYIKYLDSEYSITYLNDDLSTFEKIYVASGKNGYYPETDPTPKLSVNQGSTFSYWSFDNANKILNVTENRQAIAVYVAPSASATPSSQATSTATATASSSSSANANSSANASSSAGAKASSSPAASATSTPSNTSATYNVVVENGAGSGNYEPGKVVTITAYAAPDGKVFDIWTTSNTDIGFSDRASVSTTFIMPTHDVKVTATYKTAASSSASPSSGSNSNSSSVSGNSGSSGSNKAKEGTDVTVTTSSIDNNNKNLVSASVSGSTDNFVVKITDSASASAEVESALKQAYGDDLSNIKYVAFDISLYDETGTQKIENYDGLAVTITLPIPDDLVSYAGNNKVGAVINGSLDDKAVKFTTIDGVPCMTFTATHFSPYTVFVNTANLTQGISDATPKTGDGIAPKWFLAAGLASASGVLFLWKDKKKTVRA